MVKKQKKDALQCIVVLDYFFNIFSEILGTIIMYHIAYGIEKEKI